MTCKHLCAAALALLLSVGPGCNSGTSHGPGVATGSGGGSGITGPNGQPDDHGNDINSATFVASTQPGVPPMNGTGAIDYINDVDVFQLYLNPGTYNFATQTTGDTLLVLLDAGGNTLAANDDEDPVQNKRNSLIRQYQIPMTGFYYLAVAEGAAAQGTLPIYSVLVN